MLLQMSRKPVVHKLVSIVSKTSVRETDFEEKY